MTGYSGQGDHVEELRQKLLNAMTEWLAASNPDYEGCFITAGVVALKVASIDSEDEGYIATLLEGNLAEGSGLAMFASGFFSQAIMGM